VRAALAAGLLLAVPLAAPAQELGQKVFTGLSQPPCALCHALQAAGAAGTIGPSLDELKPDRQKVVEAVTKGVGVMPPFAGKLTPEQIAAVADYVAKNAGK
jgi:cytochrome c6